MITKLGRARFPAEACAVLQKMRCRAGEPNVISYSGAIDAQQRSERWSCALELLTELGWRGLEPDTISFGCAACGTRGSGGRWRGTLHCLGEALMRSIKPDVG
jgi:hypothetical protein